MTSLENRQKFIQGARSLLGATWRHRGRKPWAVDCLGLLVLSGKEVGVQIEEPRVYGREPWDDQLRKGLQKHFGDPLPAAEGLPGDIALIRWRNGEPSHVAILAEHPLGGLSMIHSHNLYGVVEVRVAHPFDKCIVEVYRIWHDTSSL